MEASPSDAVWRLPAPSSFIFPPVSPAISEHSSASTYHAAPPLQNIVPAVSTSSRRSLSEGRALGVLILSDQSEVLLYDGDNVIGTGVSSAVRLQSNTVDCEHAVINFGGSPVSPTIEDLASRLGSFLNSRRLTRYRAMSLCNLDTLMFGSVAATYYSIDAYLNLNL